MKSIYFDDIEKILDKDADDEFCGENVIVGAELGKDAICTVGHPYRVLDKGVIFHKGTYMSFDEDGGELMADFSLVLVYEDVPDDMFDVSKYVYFEQGTPAAAICNYLSITKDVRMEKESEEEVIYFTDTVSSALCG